MLVEFISVASKISVAVTPMASSPNSRPGTVSSAVQISSPMIRSPESPLSLSEIVVPPIAEISAVTDCILKSISVTVTSR